MFPPIFWAQVVSSVCMLAMGAACYAVASRPGLLPRYRLPWALLAAVSLGSGIIKAAQNAFGGVALVAGVGTPAWDAYLAWAPGMNYGRGLLWYAFALLLVVHGRPWGEGARVLRPAGVWMLLAAFYLAGQALGFAEGSYSRTHEGRYALLCHGEVVLLTAGLVVAVVGDRVDRLMAMAVAVHIAVLPMYSSWMWWRAHGSAGKDIPSSYYLQIYYIAFWAASLAIALRRLWLARRGVPVPGLLASLPALRPHGLPEKEPTWPR